MNTSAGASKKKKKSSRPPAPVAKVEPKKNPFDERSNRTIKHAALNRKVMGANRNVGQARMRAQMKRETELLQDFQNRKSASQVEDRRFGENNLELTREEKMLKRFQALRSGRSQRYNLGDNDDNTEEFTHLGQSLSQVLDEDDVVEEDEEDDVEADVDDLVQRMRSGENFSTTVKRTKKEAMMDVVRKSKMLKMERQKEKDQDGDERDRLDEMTSVLVQQLAFRNKHTAMQANKSEDGNYDKLVKELASSGTRVVATDRTKTAEELAKEARDELEALERERLKRQNDDHDDDDEEQGDSEEEEDGPTRKRRRKRLLRLVEEGEQMGGNIPFLIECPKSHLELLEFLNSYPEADLHSVMTRIRSTNSVHVSNENRQKLLGFCHVLVDHLFFEGDKHMQLGGEGEKVFVVCDHLYALCSQFPKETASLMFQRLEQCKRTFDTQSKQAESEDGLGGDLGKNQVKFQFAGKLPGKHKEGLHVELNAQMDRLAVLRMDDTLGTSSSRVWPSGGQFAFYSLLVMTYSTSDFRHCILSPLTMLLSKILVTAPIRGPGDVFCALQVAQLLEQCTANRFVPELAMFLRVSLAHMMSLSRSVVVEETFSTPMCIGALDSSSLKSHVGFQFLGNAHEHRTNLSYSSNSFSVNRTVFVHAVKALLDNFATVCETIPSGDILLIPLVALLVGEEDEKRIQHLHAIIHKIQGTRKFLQLQEFAPIVKASTMDPKLSQSVSARPGEMERNLKRKVKRERKGVSRELRLDSQFLAEANEKEKSTRMNQLRQVRRSNFADLQTQQANFNQMVKSGFAIKGAGVGGLNLKGRRMGTRSAVEE